MKDKNIKDLLKELAGKREELRSLRFAVAGSKNRNVKLARELRRTIARIKTELSARNSGPIRAN